MKNPSFDYPYIIEQDDNDTLLVTFVDLPGATDALNHEHAAERAQDLLEEALAAFIVLGKDIPAPSPARGRKTVRPEPLTVAKLLLYTEMRKSGVRKAELARRLKCDQKQVDRIVNLKHRSTFAQITSAFQAIGKEMTVGVQPSH